MSTNCQFEGTSIAYIIVLKGQWVIICILNRLIKNRIFFGKLLLSCDKISYKLLVF